VGKTINSLSRHDLAKLFTGVGVEVGVEKGWFSRTICMSNPGIKLYGVDCWEKQKYDRKRYTKEIGDAFREKAIKRMIDFDWTPIKKLSVDAAKDFEDESLDFVYIDAAHDYINVSNDLKAWYPKIKIGGIVSGHDYSKLRDHFDVIKAVDEFVEHLDVDLVIWAADKSPSWSFIK
jgi:hypothetical protein